METVRAFAAKYSHADAMLTVAIFALTYFAWRSVSVDLSSYGTGIATIFAGRGVHAAGKGWGAGQAEP